MAKGRGRSSIRSSARAPSSLASLLGLSPIADLRTWHPDVDRPVTDIDGRLSRIVISRPVLPFAVGNRVRTGVLSRGRTLSSRRVFAIGKPFTSSALPSRLEFKAPRRVALCVRRKSRREVIFAKRKAGAGARSRRRRHDWRSDISC